MKNFLFLLLTMLLTSCSGDFLLVRNEQSFGFACFVVVASVMGAFLFFSAFRKIIKKLLFILPMIIFSSCSTSTGAGFGNNPGTYAFFMVIGFMIGGAIGYYFIKMPDFDYEEPNPTLKQIIPSVLAWGAVLAFIGGILAYMFLLERLTYP